MRTSRIYFFFRFGCRSGGNELEGEEERRVVRSVGMPGTRRVTAGKKGMKSTCNLRTIAD